jgi:hypothetical protein
MQQEVRGVRRRSRQEVPRYSSADQCLLIEHRPSRASRPQFLTRCRFSVDSAVRPARSGPAGCVRAAEGRPVLCDFAYRANRPSRDI